MLRGAESPPNIVIFLVDDMGVMDTSVLFLTDAGGRRKRYSLNDCHRRPNMQRLADRGVRFNNFYAMSVCSPTQISIITGQNAARHRTRIAPDEGQRRHAARTKINPDRLVLHRDVQARRRDAHVGVAGGIADLRERSPASERGADGAHSASLGQSPFGAAYSMLGLGL